MFPSSGNLVNPLRLSSVHWLRTRPTSTTTRPRAVDAAGLPRPLWQARAAPPPVPQSASGGGVEHTSLYTPRAIPHFCHLTNANKNGQSHKIQFSTKVYVSLRQVVYVPTYIEQKQHNMFARQPSSKFRT